MKKRSNAKISKAELIRLHKKFKTDGPIAKKLGLTRQRIFQIRTDYEIPSSQAGNDERNAKIIALHNQGIPVANIAKTTGISPGQFYVILRQSKRTSKGNNYLLIIILLVITLVNR